MTVPNTNITPELITIALVTLQYLRVEQRCFPHFVQKSNQALNLDMITFGVYIILLMYIQVTTTEPIP